MIQCICNAVYLSTGRCGSACMNKINLLPKSRYSNPFKFKRQDFRLGFRNFCYRRSLSNPAQRRLCRLRREMKIDPHSKCDYRSFGRFCENSNMVAWLNGNGWNRNWNVLSPLFEFFSIFCLRGKLYLYDLFILQK